MTGTFASNAGPLPAATAGTSGDAVPPFPQPGPRSRLPLLAVAGGGVIVLAGAATFMLLSNGTGNDVAAGPVPARTARSTASPSLTDGSVTASTTAAGALVSGRNPFLPPDGSAATTGTQQSGDATQTGTATDASSAGTGSGSGSGSGTGSGSGSGTGSGSGSGTGSGSGAKAGTETPTYVGLYGFSGSKATFWVNDDEYQVSEGGDFGGFTYAKKTSSSCAEVTRDGTSTTICPGTVKQLG